MRSTGAGGGGSGVGSSRSTGALHATNVATASAARDINSHRGAQWRRVNAIVGAIGMFLQKWPCSAGVAPGDLALDWLLRGSVATLPHLSAFVYGDGAIPLNNSIVDDALIRQVVVAPLVFCDNARWGEDPKVGHLSASSFPALGNCQKFFGVRVGDTALVRQFNPQLTRHNFPAGTSEERPHIGPLSALDGTASSYATFWLMYNLAPRSYREN